ncbi:expressed unknown protein [Seminavis robusta]|uniref:Uncharacterized protein n=1 Tax=Seminavis robusta TaxID=568900 RepID=A0A9N8E584_9STRA|nr:expressed unknown protein [Seminavis robusta]|eukprot:Sro685_g186880.1 n/a (503) ;mRNA; f:19018-20652
MPHARIPRQVKPRTSQSPDDTNNGGEGRKSRLCSGKKRMALMACLLLGLLSLGGTARNLRETTGLDLVASMWRWSRYRSVVSQPSHYHLLGNQAGEEGNFYVSPDAAADSSLQEDSPLLPMAYNMEAMKNHSSVDQSFCVPWRTAQTTTSTSASPAGTTEADDWWTHHPQWQVFYEDDQVYCFQLIPNPAKRDYLQKLYQLQFPSSNDCSNVQVKPMIQGGWGMDMLGIVHLLWKAIDLHQPHAIAPRPWHYASPKPFNIQTAACPSQDMFCYFLPLTSCNSPENNNNTVDEKWFPRDDQTRYWNEKGHWLYQYGSRPQEWLRYRVYRFVQHQLHSSWPAAARLASNTNSDFTCTALHVRRADVILHKRWSRAYHSIAEYMNVSDQIHDNIFLLTDDSNAVGEAVHEFPHHNWIYVDRKRYKGAEGGWEQQLPSQDPAFEVTVILGVGRLVQKCDGIVKSFSRFGAYLYGELHAANQSAWYKDVDAQSGSQLLNPHNTATKN